MLSEVHHTQLNAESVLSSTKFPGTWNINHKHYCEAQTLQHTGHPSNTNSHQSIVKTFIWTIWALAVTLTLKIAIPSFCMTLQLLKTDHNTKFGKKMSGGLEDIIWMYTGILPLPCDLDLECSNPFFFTGHSGLRWCIIRPSLVGEDSAVMFWS